MKIIRNNIEYEVCEYCYERLKKSQICMPGYEQTDDKRFDWLIKDTNLHTFNGGRVCRVHGEELERLWWEEKRQEYIRMGGRKDEYPIVLNEYQILNLNWLLHIVWNDFIPGTNTGDWAGEIPHILSRCIANYGETFTHYTMANKTFKDFFEDYRVKPVIEKWREELKNEHPAHLKRFNDKIAKLIQLDTLPIDKQWKTYKSSEY
jgi:hypothetical protein